MPVSNSEASNFKIINGFLCSYKVVSKNPTRDEIRQALAIGEPVDLIETEEVVTPSIMNVLQSKNGSDILQANPTGWRDGEAVGYKTTVIETEHIRDLAIIDFREFLSGVLSIDYEEAFPGFNWDEMFARLNPINQSQ